MSLPRVRRLAPVLPFLSALLAVWVWSRYHASQYDPEQGLNVIEGIEAIDLAQVARSVAEGEGFVTRFVRPVALRYQESAIGQPELTRPPLYILVLALAMKFLETSDGTVAAVSADVDALDKAAEGGTRETMETAFNALHDDFYKILGKLEKNISEMQQLKRELKKKGINK